MNNENHQISLSKEHIDSIMALYSSGRLSEAIDAIKLLNEKYPNVRWTS